VSIESEAPKFVPAVVETALPSARKSQRRRMHQVDRILRAHALAVGPILRLWRWTRAVARDSAARTYTDLAPTPVRDDEDETALELIQATAGGRAAVAHARRIAGLTAVR
jgi:hypothetical protein